jgi:hypothetical protein
MYLPRCGAGTYSREPEGCTLELAFMPQKSSENRIILYWPSGNIVGVGFRTEHQMF